MNIPFRARSCRCLLPSLVVPMMAMRLPPTAVGTVTLFAMASLACGLDTDAKDQADSTGTATLVVSRITFPA